MGFFFIFFCQQAMVRMGLQVMALSKLICDYCTYMLVRYIMYQYV